MYHPSFITMYMYIYKHGDAMNMYMYVHEQVNVYMLTDLKKKKVYMYIQVVYDFLLIQ